MNTRIQVAAEARRELAHIENYLEESGAPTEVRNRTIDLRSSIMELAALQVTPTQGSIADSAEFWAELSMVRLQKTPHLQNKRAESHLVPLIDTHIAQRAASGDAKGGMDIEEVIDEVGARREITDIWMQRALKAEAKLAAPAPTADQVRYNKDGSTSILHPEGDVSTFNMPRPAQMPIHDPDAAVPIPYVPAPKTSAPDAPAGDSRKEFDVAFKKLDPTAPHQVLDISWAGYPGAMWRAARATAAPAGHAEPVAWRKGQYGYQTLFNAIADSVRSTHTRTMNISVEAFEKAMLAAPVAAEPAPPVPAQPGAVSRLVVRGDSMAQRKEGIDAHVLLAKYMQHVVKVEGVHFVDGDCPDYLTESEWAALKAVADARWPAQEGGDDE